MNTAVINTTNMVTMSLLIVFSNKGPFDVYLQYPGCDVTTATSAGVTTDVVGSPDVLPNRRPHPTFHHHLKLRRRRLPAALLRLPLPLSFQLPADLNHTQTMFSRSAIGMILSSVCPSVTKYSKSVRPSVRLSVRHTLALSQNDSSYDHGVFTGG